MARAGSNAGAGRQLDLNSLEARLRAIDSERQQVLGQIRKFIDHAKRLVKSTANPSLNRRVRRRVVKANTRRRKRRMSPEARKRISEAQKKRWAANRAQAKEKKH